MVNLYHAPDATVQVSRIAATAKMLASQTLALVIRPALKKLRLWSPSAEELVFGTAIVESGLTYLKQHGDGPALGLWQVEPAPMTTSIPTS